MTIRWDSFEKVRRLITKSDLSPADQQSLSQLLELLSSFGQSQERGTPNASVDSQPSQSILDTSTLLATVQQQAAELDTLRKLSSSLTSSLEISAVLDAVVREAMRLLKKARDAHIFLYDAEKDQLEFGSSLDSSGSRRKVTAPPRQDGLTYAVARKGRTILVEDMRNHPLYRSSPDDWTGSIIGIPLMMDKTVVGVMNISRSITGGFSNSELRLLNLLADQAAIAISNARLHAVLNYQAYTDTITGLPNRRALDEHIEREVQKARRNGTTFAVIMMDLDHFKEINDTYGHAVGDQVLRVTFNYLAQNLRTTDFLARFGGDELTLLLSQADLQAAIQVSQKIVDSLVNYFVQLPDGKRAKIGITGGIAIYPTHARTASDLLRAADEALYRSKKTERGTFLVARGFTGPLSPGIANYQPLL